MPAHRLLEADGRVLRRLAQGVRHGPSCLRVLQLNGLDAPCEGGGRAFTRGRGRFGKATERIQANRASQPTWELPPRASARFSAGSELPALPGTPLCPTCVIEVSSPLVVVGLLGEHGLGDELLRLVVEVVVEIVPQQQVEERGLPVRVVAQRGRPQPGVQEAAGQERERILGRGGGRRNSGRAPRGQPYLLTTSSLFRNS